MGFKKDRRQQNANWNWHRLLQGREDWKEWKETEKMVKNEIKEEKKVKKNLDVKPTQLYLEPHTRKRRKTRSRKESKRQK